MNFGYPYCHQGDFLDPEVGGRSCKDAAPVPKLGAHVAPIGMRFYTGKMFRPSTEQHLHRDVAREPHHQAGLRRDTSCRDAKGNAKMQPFAAS
jgi:hypothetical protein